MSIHSSSSSPEFMPGERGLVVAASLLFAAGLVALSGGIGTMIEGYVQSGTNQASLAFDPTIAEPSRADAADQNIMNGGVITVISTGAATIGLASLINLGAIPVPRRRRD